MNIDEIINQIPYLIFSLIQFLAAVPPSPYYQWFVIIRAIFIIISLFLLITIIYFISKSSWKNFRFLESTTEFFTYKPYGAGKIVKQWEKIKHRLKTASEAESKLIIIEADSILNEALGKMGFTGQTLEERLKRLGSDLLSNIEELLEAHKICNNIIHDPDYRLNLEETKRIILIYEKTLIDLQIL